MYSYKLHTKNRSCPLLNKWINQKHIPTQHQPNTNAHNASLFPCGFYSPRTFTPTSILPTLSFCAEPKAKLQNPSSKRSPLPSRNGGGRCRRWVRTEEELFPSPLLLHIEHPFLGEKVSLAFMRHWILQLRASPACRMTCRWAERLEDETSSLKCKVTNCKLRTALLQC